MTSCDVTPETPLSGYQPDIEFVRLYAPHVGGGLLPMWIGHPNYTTKLFGPSDAGSGVD